MILIFVISIISSLTFLTTQIADDLYIYQTYVNDYKNRQQLYLISDTALKAVKNFLLRDDPAVDSFQDFWASEIPIITQEAQITINIIDQERYLNPNFLINKDGKTVNKKVFNIFERLFNILGYDTSILFNIIDWIDKDRISQGGKENYDEYNAKNDYLDSLEELKLIDGITPEIFNGTVMYGQFIPGLRSLLSPYSNGKVNINTASKYILQSLDPQIDQQIVLNILTYRKEKPFKTINDLALVDGVTSDIVYRLKKLGLIDVKSENFLVDIKINFNDNIYHLMALLQRKNKNIDIIWRKIY